MKAKMDRCVGLAGMLLQKMENGMPMAETLRIVEAGYYTPRYTSDG
jgi:hypothetical protein